MTARFRVEFIDPLRPNVSADIIQPPAGIEIHADTAGQDAQGTLRLLLKNLGGWLLVIDTEGGHSALVNSAGVSCIEIVS